MYDPIRVDPPAILPVTLDEAKEHIVDVPDADDGLVAGLIEAAVNLLDGWQGTLGGTCLVDQEWEQQFDDFDYLNIGRWSSSRYFRGFRLMVRPLISVSSIKWRNTDGELATIAADNYQTKRHAGHDHIVFDQDYDIPSPLHDFGAVTVTYRAGYPNVGVDPDLMSTVPDDIKLAIKMMVAHWYAHRETVVVGTSAMPIPLTADLLLGKYRLGI